ncbi:alpha/beta fold hydrolase [Alteromonas sp. a30]|uniref:alpha/beta fold hydrolase n=1 Tax=Alteromonas sp. a30 TaxID=2730917 RepID=UPI00228238EF|nr:alpha/beta hydrolase [Alteromonas sp. a30]MCY7294076.1 alpha/beta hydrolase [Alteromonas sp. a30]
MNELAKIGLKTLCYLAPKQAGQIATKLFTQSRNATNPHRKAYTPIGAQSISIEAYGRKVRQYYMWGDSGDIVLLLHGWGSECGSMFSLASYLAKQGHRVVTFDAPAHGASAGKFASMSEYVSDTKLILNELSSFGTVTRVVAHSLGGIVAMAATKEFPAIKQVVLISAPYSLNDVLSIWSRNVINLGSKVRDNVLRQLLKDNGVPVSYWDISLHGKEHHADILVVHAIDDNIIDIEHGERICNALPSATMETVDELGHIKILSSLKVHQKISHFFNA